MSAIQVTADLSVVASFIEPIASISAKDDLGGNIVEVSEV